MIDILKSSLETKVEELGLNSLFEYSLSKTSKPDFIKNKVDIFTEITKVQMEINNYNKSKNKNDELINKYENQISSMKERIKQLEHKFDETETRRLRTQIEYEEMNKN